MKNIFKRALCLFAATALTLGTVAIAQTFRAVEPKYNVLVDGVRFYCDPPVLVSGGRTYLPLRALGDALGVYVEWDGAAKQVIVDTKKEVEPKAPVLENGYDSFSDVPDFGKVTGTECLAEESELIDFGYLSNYGYLLNDIDAQDRLSNYFAILKNTKFEQFYSGNTDEYENMLLLNAETGRMIQLLVMGNVFVVSVFEKTYTPDEWAKLDRGETLPQKEFQAHLPGFKVMVDGKEFVSDTSALVVEGRTYLPLRAMGDALGVFVDWDAENQQVIVESNKAE